MKIVFYSLILNNHQANIADELWELTNHQFCFVELANLQAEHRKGDTRDYTDCPYLLRAWESSQSYAKAMILAQEAECCIFSGVLALPFQKARMKLGRLSFDMSERWLKRGIINLFSPSIFQMFLSYHLGGWGQKPLYKLCCSAFAAHDQRKLLTFKNKCYKWGYFTKVDNNLSRTPSCFTDVQSFSLMWCSRYLKWKHPELPVMLAARLKSLGYRFTLDMYGSGEYESQTKFLVSKLGIENVVHFMGTKSNEELLQDMKQHHIFLFTSDQNEGWGAVANESMANGCVLVASDAIGSVPYLVRPNLSGVVFKAPRTSSSFAKPDLCALSSLCDKVKNLLDHPSKLYDISQFGMQQMQEEWSPQVAAHRLLQLIECLQLGMEPDFKDGPCSKA